MSVNMCQVKTNTLLYPKDQIYFEGKCHVKKPAQFTIPGVLPAAFLCYIFYVMLHSDLYSNLEMYCFIFTQLLYSVIVANI